MSTLAPKEIDALVGQRLKTLRKSKGLSQSKLGDAIGVTFQQIQKCERGANRIGASRLFQFSEILDAPISYFFETVPGASEESDGLDIFDTDDAKNIAKAFFKITDPATRKAFTELVKSLSNGADMTIPKSL
jgi:transcriptional regulator with XRE-family HTH domain